MDVRCIHNNEWWMVLMTDHHIHYEEVIRQCPLGQKSVDQLFDYVVEPLVEDLDDVEVSQASPGSIRRRPKSTLWGLITSR